MNKGKLQETKRWVKRLLPLANVTLRMNMYPSCETEQDKDVLSDIAI